MCSLMLYPLHIKSILSRNLSKCWFSEACPMGAILASKIDQLRFSNPHFRILRVKYSLMQKVSSLCDNLFNIDKIKALCLWISNKMHAHSCRQNNNTFYITRQGVKGETLHLNVRITLHYSVQNRIKMFFILSGHVSQIWTSTNEITAERNQRQF